MDLIILRVEILAVINFRDFRDFRDFRGFFRTHLSQQYRSILCLFMIFYIIEFNSLKAIQNCRKLSACISRFFLFKCCSSFKRFFCCRVMLKLLCDIIFQNLTTVNFKFYPFFKLIILTDIYMTSVSFNSD